MTFGPVGRPGGGAGGGEGDGDGDGEGDGDGDGDGDVGFDLPEPHAAAATQNSNTRTVLLTSFSLLSRLLRPLITIRSEQDLRDFRIRLDPLVEKLEQPPMTLRIRMCVVGRDA